ncbi:hypothetical protein DPMN_099951 [Dreissena polymorpha]|uniref:Uncharacterized protein n=1 Tax=Dreissena polymorpha TaxID=45954 RepID=A0A9D4LGE9_DREPO|nr:hypothetical protein DPMN_099951 [Dreissena polymorpha]
MWFRALCLALIVLSTNGFKIRSRFHRRQSGTFDPSSMNSLPFSGNPSTLKPTYNNRIPPPLIRRRVVPSPQTILLTHSQAPVK